jgi:hypothetical protein
MGSMFYHHAIAAGHLHKTISKKSNNSLSKQSQRGPESAGGAKSFRQLAISPNNKKYLQLKTN